MKISARMSAVAICAAAVLVASSAQAVKVGPVEDPIRVVKIRKGEPIQIGGYFVLSGPDTQVGLDEYRGAQVAVKDLGGTLAGHPIKYWAEDSLCTPEGGQTAATKLAANEQVVAVVGATCSSEATVAAPILWDAGIPNIGVTSSSPALTDPARDDSYAGFLRVMFNDGWMGERVAVYLRDVAKVERIATIHDGSVFGEKLTSQVREVFEGLGGKVCAAEAIAPTDVDMRPMLTKLATCEPQLVYMPLFVAAAAHVTRQAKEIKGLESVPLLGMDATYTADFVKAAGKGAIGYRFATTALEDEARGAGYQAMRETYREMFGEYPVQGFHTHGYDAMMLAAKAIEAVAVTDDEGNTYIPIGALRDALYATDGLKGMTGTIACDAYGDCGVFKLAVYEYVSDDPEKFGIGENPVRVWPEKFD